MTICKKCLKDLPDDKFGKRKEKKNGLTSWCKICNNERSARNRVKFKDKIRQYHKKLNQDPLFKAKRRDYCREWARKNPLTEDQKAKKRERQNRYYRDKPNIKIEMLCRNKTRDLINKGIITPKPCEYPNCKYPNLTVEAHHWDYSKPLYITWFCSYHHGLADRIRRLIN